MQQLPSVFSLFRTSLSVEILDKKKHVFLSKPFNQIGQCILQSLERDSEMSLRQKQSVLPQTRSDQQCLLRHQS